SRGNLGRPAKVRRLSPRTVAEMKQKIRADRIIDRLQRHIMSSDGVMAPSAVTAALGLLRKMLPDLQAVDMKTQVEQKPASEMTDAELEAEIARIAAQIRAVVGEDEAPADPKLTH